MTTTDPLSGFSTTRTSQMEPIPGRTDQVQNNEGGFVFQIDPLAQFRRFLTMGTAGGTFYVGQKEMTRECGELVLALANGAKESHTNEIRAFNAIQILTDMSIAGRLPKQNPALFALAIFCQHGTSSSKKFARKRITTVVRTGTHLFIFMRYLKQFGTMPHGLRTAIGKWYTEKSADKLAYQLIKYRQREGYTHRDVLRITHPKFKLSPEMQELKTLSLAEEIEPPPELLEAEKDLRLKRNAVAWTLKESELNLDVPEMIKGFRAAQKGVIPVPLLLEAYKLPWEALPDSAMTDVKVWDKMLDNGMPTEALLRQLPRLTNLGVVSQLGGRTDEIIAQLTDPEKLQKARTHPINVLTALKTYARGQGKGSSWVPVAKMIDGLDEMFYQSFDFVPTTGLRYFQAIDISGSMRGSSDLNAILSPAEVATAMALVTAKTEPEHAIMGFSSRSGRNTRDPLDSKMTPLNISSRQRLDDATRATRNKVFGGTDCALPMLFAAEQSWKVDVFTVYTDNETHHGDIHPVQALQHYRKVSGIDAKLVVVSVTPTKFSIADPTDKGMLDISGFDSAVPNLISDFATGAI